MLSQTAFVCIKNYLNCEISTANFEHGGIGLELKNAPNEMTEAVFQTMLAGFKNVQTVAPDVLKIEFIELNAPSENTLQKKINRMNQSSSGYISKINSNQVKISADIYKDENEKISGFSINEKNSEMPAEMRIYCAGIWAISKAVFLTIKDYLKCDINFVTEAGKLELTLKNSANSLTETVFQMLMIGLREIEKLVPQVLKINVLNKR
jgi:hypothetical protein